MKKKKKQLKGFTLIETIITMSMFLVILSGVYMMIQHYGDVSKSEHSRVTMQQESRFMVSVFADEIKESGAVLTVAHTSKFLAAPPFFNGLYPLNSTDYPDGLILATGDPEAVTRLNADFDGSKTVLNVENANVSAHDPYFPYENPQWGPGQKGIVIGTTGYLVFSVVEVPDVNTINIRSTPVYYSGLLKTGDADVQGSYIDDAQGNTKGNALTYSAHSPVIRLSNFSIYLFRDTKDDKLSAASGSTQMIRQMIRVTDTYGEANPFKDGSAAELSVISENIWDMQISYIAYTDFKSATPDTTIDDAHHYFAGGSTSAEFSNLMDDIRGRLLKQMDITIVAIADLLPGRGTSGLSIPTIADNASNSLPDRKMGFRLFTFSIEPRNYGVTL